MPANFPAQELFRHFVQLIAEHLFVSSVFFTDGTCFGRYCTINIHNQHQWAKENHHGVIHSRQQQFSIV
jgi:hypothetical protein